jgi:hypothetical protein
MRPSGKTAGLTSWLWPKLMRLTWEPSRAQVNRERTRGVSGGMAPLNTMCPSGE